MKRTGADIITTLLKRQGIRTIVGIPGGATLPLYDSLRTSGIQHVLARHEQGAGFIAQGMARATGRAGVCLATSGPGVTNLLTAVADAKLDSVPLVAVTGQVPTALIGSDAFQEVDTYRLAAPITKHTFCVRRAAQLLEVIPAAFEIAESSRPGPVVVDVPKDVQRQTAEFDTWPQPAMRASPPACDPSLVERLAEMIRCARRPVLYVGGGVVASAAQEHLMALAARNGIPVTSTLAGLGAFPSDHSLFLGMLGMHGARYTNWILDEADLILAFGVRFDDRATGRAADFCPGARIAHVDIDPGELDKIKTAHLAIAADAGKVLQALTPKLQANARKRWNRRVRELKARFPLQKPSTAGGISPFDLIMRVSQMVDADTIVTTDVGQHQMWVAQAYPFRRPRTLLTSGGLGTMGFGLPAAIGAALADPHRRIICFSGDGSLLMNIQELATLAELDLNVTVIVLNNGHLGLVRQQQELFYGGRVFASRFHRPVDYASIAQSFGIRGLALPKNGHLEATLALALSRPGPSLLNVPIQEAENVLPMVPPGAANREMVEDVPQRPYSPRPLSSPQTVSLRPW